MKAKTSFWQRMGLQDWFLKKESYDRQQPSSLTADDVYTYILQKFNESVSQLSFAHRVVFYHEYIIILNGEDYKIFMEQKKGIFGLIVQESIKKFYEILKKYSLEGKTVEASSPKWVFRFVSHPDYARGDKGFIGKLLTGSYQKQENLRVTFIPRQTGIAETAEVSEEILKGFTFYSEGYYEVPYQQELVYDENKMKALSAVLARLEAILPDRAYAGKKIEYLMKDLEITVTGGDDTREATHIFRIPSEWVNSSHLRIRYNKEEDKFYLSSFGEKTMLNEKEVPPSDPQHPAWTQLPINSKLVLNGIVTINIFKA